MGGKYGVMRSKSLNNIVTIIILIYKLFVTIMLGLIEYVCSSYGNAA